jgi:hypothetical protein
VTVPSLKLKLMLNVLVLLLQELRHTTKDKVKQKLNVTALFQKLKLILNVLVLLHQELRHTIKDKDRDKQK